MSHRTASALAVATFLAAVLGAGPSAQVPRITPPQDVPVVKLPPGEQPATLARMDVRVRVSGLEAETEATLTFRNPNGRALAGDLEFPLPDGAVVAGYALDIGGRMVDGVNVSKEKARVVLETEMRRRVDPGIVEHVRGNLFRTRIFPLPARGERTVRVLTVSPLSVSGGDAACHVPLPRVAIPSLSLHVEVAKGPVRPGLGGFGNLTLKEWSDKWAAETTLTDTTPGDDLYVRLPKLPALLTAVEAFEGERFVSISHAPSLPASSGSAPVRRAAIAWDGSGSRSPSAVRRDVAFLAALLATPAWRSAIIDLVVFRDRPDPVKSFTVTDGKAAGLFAHLEALPYDGGTDLAGLDLRKSASPGRDAEAWVVFTDGLCTLGAGLPRFDTLPIHVVASDTLRDSGLQRFLAAATGGLFVDLTVSQPDEAARTLSHPRVTLLRVEASPGTLDDIQFRFTPGSGRASVHARLVGNGDATLVYGTAGHEVQRVPVPLAGVAPRPGRIIARAWASRMVEQLAVFPDRNEAEMTGLGRRFGLVTPVTSLIVLETAQQYLQHGIEPPASWPEMRQQYLAGLQARKGQERQRVTSKIERVVGWWNERVAWWHREFRYQDGFRWSRKDQVTGGDERLRNRVEGGVPGGVVGGVVGGVAPAAPAVAPAGVRAEAPAEALRSARAATDVAMQKSAEAKGGGSAPASIAIKAWSPDRPYLTAIKAASPRQAYAAYLGQRTAYADSPSFYLDCAGVLMPADRILGLRVLSNLAELRIDDAALLRVFAWRLIEAGELDRAVETLERVKGLRPEDPQSLRDLALALADRMDRTKRSADGVRASRLLYDVITGEWSRFEQVEVVALMELNRLLARLERLDPAAARTVDYVDARLRTRLDLDARIVMSWDADNTDIDLHVIEPSGEEAFYGHNLTTIGGHVSQDFTQGYGPEEYVLHHAMPGVYKIRCKYYGSSQQTLVGPATVSAVVITNFGRPDERRQVLTLRLEQVKEMVDIGEVTIGAGSVTATKPAPRVTRALVESLGRGASRADVERVLGAPERVEGSGVTLLVYRLADGSEVRLAFGPGLLWAKQMLNKAELEVKLR